MSWGRADGVLSYKGFDFACAFKRVKYLRLKLGVRGDFRLTVPLNYSKKTVLEFLDKNEAWIEEKFAKMQKSLKNSENELEFLGKRYELRFDEDAKKVSFLKEPNPKTKFSKNEQEKLTQKEGLNFSTNIIEENSEAKKGIIIAKNKDQLEAFLRMNARKIYSFYIKKWQGCFETPVRHLSIKKMTTRWGSCNSKKGYINLNLSLIARPLNAIEYVVLHELVHLKFAHHQKSFYDELESLMPDYKKREELLKTMPFQF